MSRQELIDEISSITDASLQLKVGEAMFYVEKLPGTYDFDKVTKMKGSRALGYLLSERDKGEAYLA